MSSRPYKMLRYGRIDVTDEAVINEFNCIEQIYIRFQAPFGLNKKVSFRANCLFLRKNCYFQGKLSFSGQFFSAPAVRCLPVRLWWFLLLRIKYTPVSSLRMCIPTTVCTYIFLQAFTHISLPM